jgi:hypothetical protein
MSDIILDFFFPKSFVILEILDSCSKDIDKGELEYILKLLIFEAVYSVVLVL